MIDGVWIPIIAVASVPIMVVGLPIARAYARAMEGGSRAPAIPHDVVARLERMEQAIDAVAVEVERISEGQRFTTRLLSERAESVAPVRPGDAGPR